jgi:hypothetical protein
LILRGAEDARFHELGSETPGNCPVFVQGCKSSLQGTWRSNFCKDFLLRDQLRAAWTRRKIFDPKRSTISTVLRLDKALAPAKMMVNRIEAIS